MFTNSLFYLVAPTVAKSRSLIDARRSPIVAGVTPDGTGLQVVQVFHHTNIGLFFYLQLKSRKCNTSRTPVYFHSYSHCHWRPDKATYSITRNPEYEQGECRADYDWPEIQEDQLNRGGRILETG